MRPARGRAGVALLVLAAFATGPFPVPAGADPPAPRTYAGTPYSDDFRGAPTRPANQSKLWFHADAWWALLLEPDGRRVRVFELRRDHTWRPTSAVVNTDAADTGDALSQGEVVHVVTRRRDASLHYVRLSFDPATRDYRAAEPVLVTTRGGLASATIAQDGTRRLWVAFAAGDRVTVTHSGGGGRGWARPDVLAATGAESIPEQVALVAFDDRVGVAWSDQRVGAVGFAWHRDGAAPGSWTREVALAGPGRVDAHISLRRVRGEPSDTLVAAVETARTDRTPGITVLVRAPGGRWSAVAASTVADGLDSPVLQVDEATRTLHLFAAFGGDVVTKRASVDDVRFAPGSGELFVLGGAGRLTDPAGTRDAVDARTGLVVLGSGAAERRYRHAELPIGGPAPRSAPDDLPPSAPGDLRGQAAGPGAVGLTWAGSSDGSRWAPASDGVPVRGYVVSRDGVELGTVGSTSFGDKVREPSAAPAELRVEYAVQAVDRAGNRSAPSRVVVVLPAADPPRPALVGALLLVTGALVAVIAARAGRGGAGPRSTPAARARRS